MSIPVVLAVLLFSAVLFAIYVRSVRQRYMREIMAMRNSNADLEVQVKDLKAQALLRKGRVESLEKSIEQLRKQCDELRGESSLGDTPLRSPAQILLGMGKITDDDMVQAQEYVDGPGRGMPLEKALVALGLATAEDMELAARDASDSQERSGS